MSLSGGQTMTIDPYDLAHQIKIYSFEDDFLLVRASYTQKVNGGFLIEVDAAHVDPNFEIEDIIGKAVGVHIGVGDENGATTPSAKILHGVVIEGRWTGETVDHCAFAAFDSVFQTGQHLKPRVSYRRVDSGEVARPSAQRSFAARIRHAQLDEALGV